MFLKCVIQGLLVEADILPHLTAIQEMWAKPDLFAFKDLLLYIYSYQLIDGILQAIHLFRNFQISSRIIRKIK